MTASSVTGIGPGDSEKRIAYITPNTLPVPQLLATASNPQDLLGTGISPSAVGGGGGGTVPPLANVFFVAKNGNDGTGDGSIGKPYLTIQAGINAANAVATISATTRPCVWIMAGNYTENPVLGANIILRGLGFNHTRIVGNISIDSTWTPPGDFRGGLADLGLFGNLVMDFNSVSANEGKLYAWNVRFGGSLTFTSFSAVNQFLMFGGEYFGTLTLNGMQTVLSGVTSEGGTLVLQAAPNGRNILVTAGGSLSNVVVSQVPNLSYTATCTFGHAVQNGATLTIDGTFPIISTAVTSLPIESLISLTNGASLTQVTNINDANLFVLPGNILTVSGNAAIDGTEEVVFVNTTGTPVSLQLPNPILYRKIKIKDVGGNLAVNNLTLVRFAGETIEGVAANAVFSTNYQAINIQSDGVNWWLI